MRRFSPGHHHDVADLPDSTEPLPQSLFPPVAIDHWPPDSWCRLRIESFRDDPDIRLTHP